MSRHIMFLIASIFLGVLASWPGHAAQKSTTLHLTTMASCPVTLPRESPLREFRGSNVYWNHELFVAGLPQDGTMVFRPRYIVGGILAQKFGWYRGPGLRGKLTITGRRLDARAPALRVDIGDISDNGEGFAPSELIFPTEGCWEVTGKVNKTSVIFVLRVVRSADDK
jgi:hypothetical protein